VSRPAGGRLSFSDGSLYVRFNGPIINANTTKENKIKGALTTNLGYVRVSGTGTSDPNTSTFTGDSSWIFWNEGSVQMTEVGKYGKDITVPYKGVCTAKIIPAAAGYYNVVGGVVSVPALPVSATIIVPGFPISNDAPQL
jgi:hypothetical protein